MTILAARACTVGLAVLSAFFTRPVRADFQEITPKKGQQNSVEVDTGADGICNTTAMPDDVQAIPVGSAPAFQAEIKCGANKVVETTAAGDDTQLLAPSSACPNANTAVIDTGANGIADTTAAGDDGQLITVGSGPANTPCVLSGGNGIANTPDPVGGDDVRILPVNTAKPNTAVIRCGPNKIVESHANNSPAALTGDDVQVLAVGASCGNKNTIVVNSGPNGIADTRAEGTDLVLKVGKPVKVTISRGAAIKTKTIKVSVSNVEFGATAPASRTYSLVVDDGNCPSGTVSNVDANASTTLLDATASVPKGSKVKGSFMVTFHIEDVTTIATNVPFRCAVNVEADAVDSAPNADDASNVDNNSTPVDFEVFDRNDLP